MGLGDEIMNSGIARGAAARGRRIAFGDGRNIMWHHTNAKIIFANNPNVAPPGSECAHDLEWVPSYPGRRPYHRWPRNLALGHWEFVPSFRATPGEIFFTREEKLRGERMTQFDVLIEPSVKLQAPNKQWPVERYEAVAQKLSALGLYVGQMVPHLKAPTLRHAAPFWTPNFRIALMLMSRARMFVGPEGGLHHASAAFGVPATVLFGGYIHPQTTGYDFHTNIFVGDEPCGRTAPCEHCRAAMDAITVEEVVEATVSAFDKRIAS